MERVADYLIKALHDAGIEHIFMVTGRGNLFLSDAVAKEDGLCAVPTYHEQGASYAAIAYALSKGGLGACLVSTGCAATNAMTAALCAWQDNLPVGFISGQNMLRETTAFTGLPIRTYGSQETDILPMVRPITKYAVMLQRPVDIAYELEKALFLARFGRRGPVWIDIPLDVQNMRIAPETLARFKPCFVTSQDSVWKREAAWTAQELSHAERPVLLLGGGSRIAQSEVMQLVERVHIPVVFTPAAADVYGAGQPLSIGAVSSLGGSRAGNFALQNADYILAIGTKLCSQMTGNDMDSFARAADITIVDIDPLEHTKQGEPTARHVQADAGTFLSRLLEEDLQEVRLLWREKCVAWKETFAISEETFVKDSKAKDEIDLYQLADALSTLLPDGATVITDAGFEELIVPSSVRFHDGQRCLFPAAQGAMGYAIPAILGAYFAGRKHIVCVVGDGSIMMNVQELQAIRQHEIPAKILVINNDMYAVIRKRQKDLFRRRTIGTGNADGVSSPDFQKIANAFDFQYRKIERLSEMGAQLKMLLQEDGPVLCEILCTQEQKYLHQSYGVDENRHLVQHPLEDLSPFMEREKLAREMLIPLWKGKK